METERQKNLRRIYELLDGRREPGGGLVISLSIEKKKREARALAKKARRLAQGADEQPRSSGGSREEE